MGITRPAHRKKIKSEIAKLNIGDGLPDFVPTAVQEWLRLLGLEEYLGNFVQQGIATMQVSMMAWFYDHVYEDFIGGERILPVGCYCRQSLTFSGRILKTSAYTVWDTKRKSCSLSNAFRT